MKARGQARRQEIVGVPGWQGQENITILLRVRRCDGSAITKLRWRDESFHETRTNCPMNPTGVGFTSPCAPSAVYRFIVCGSFAIRSRTTPFVQPKPTWFAA